MRAPGGLGACLQARLGAWRAIRPRAPHATPARSGRSGRGPAARGEPLLHPAAPGRAGDRSGSWSAGPGAAGGRDARSRGAFGVRLHSCRTPLAPLCNSVLIRPPLPDVFYGLYICITIGAHDAHTRALSIGPCPRGGGAEAGSCGCALHDRGRWSRPAPGGCSRLLLGLCSVSLRRSGSLAPGPCNLLP